MNINKKDLAQQVAELELLLQSVTCDLQSPLRGIDGFIEMFTEKYIDKLDWDARRLLFNVATNVGRMKHKLDELTILSEIALKELHNTDINMQELLVSVVDDLKDMKGKSQLTLFNIVNVIGDPLLTRLLWVNLLSNAYNRTVALEQPRIEIGCKDVDGLLLYYIKDNGVAFNQKEENKDPGADICINLAIVKRIVNRHNGTFVVENETPGGVTFYFSFQKN